MSNSDNDPNGAYTVIPMPANLRGTSDYWAGWWTVTRNGVPVRHYPPKDYDLAERFAADPAYRAAAREPTTHEGGLRAF